MLSLREKKQFDRIERKLNDVLDRLCFLTADLHNHEEVMKRMLRRRKRKLSHR